MCAFNVVSKISEVDGVEVFVNVKEPSIDLEL